MKVENKTFFVLLFLGVVLLTLQLQNITLRSVDAPVYSSMARELMERPLSTWVQVTWRDGSGFYDNPQLTPWILAVSFKMFGVSAFSASLPIVLISILTIVALYLLGSELVNKRFGHLSMIALILCPQFLKDGRNPMLEPAIMLFTTLSIYFALRSINRKKISFALFAGVCTALAFLAKGPMAFLTFGVIPVFYIINNLYLQEEKHKTTLFNFLKQFLILTLSFVFILGVVDLWHYFLHHESFFKLYFEKRLLKTLTFKADPAYHIGRDYFYYIKVLLKKYWPWIPLCLISPLLFLRKTNNEIRAGLIMGLLITLGYLIPFSVITFKASWYVNLMHVGLALLSATVIYQAKTNNLIERNFRNIALTISIVVLFLSSTFPKLFIRERPMHEFLMGAHKTVGEKIKKGGFCSTILSDPWPFEFLNRFYLRLHPADCTKTLSYKYKIIDVTKSRALESETILYVRHPYALLEVNR